MSSPVVYSEEGPGKLAYSAHTWTLAYARSTWVDGGRGRLNLIDTPDGPALQNSLGVDLSSVVLIEGDPTATTEVLRQVVLGPLPNGERVLVGDRWQTGAPGGDLRWPWKVLREQPEAVGAHLHGSSFRYLVLAVAEEPVESIALTGLAPIEQNLTVFRAPLGPPVAPERPAWSDDLP